jgi:hypothetical protein
MGFGYGWDGDGDGDGDGMVQPDLTINNFHLAGTYKVQMGRDTYGTY